jgi:uncharacterized protein YPO0396
LVTSNQTTVLDLEPARGGPAPGFRLARIEVYNWGTFDQRVWTLKLDGKNALLTGGNGAGKSTVVDAITTLLVPPTRVQYNKAAGADDSERSLRSYVLGYYKSERNETTGGGKAAQLRGVNSYSVLLGVFHNAELRQTVSLAQVFWVKEGVNTPNRFYACAARDLTIATDFGGFGLDLSALRKRLRASEVTIEESFTKYAHWFCRHFGIETGQPLELFNQAVSMKSVGNLTAFVRDRMLPPFQVKDRIEALITHFDDLNRSHEAVLKAKRQVEMLTPIIGQCERHREVAAEAEHLRACRDALHSYFARYKLALIDERLIRLEEEWTRHDNLVKRQAEHEQQSSDRLSGLRDAIAANGGDRLQRLNDEIQRKSAIRDNRRNRSEQYAAALAPLREELPPDEETFLAQRSRLAGMRQSLEAKKAEADNDLMEAKIRLRNSQEEYDKLDKELKGLRSRRSNIDNWHINLRAALCKDLGRPEAEMPFAGELLQVREEAQEWEGAAERVLRGLGLSMLVPDALYSDVSRWVNEHHLGGRFIYFHVHRGSAIAVSDLHRDALARKVSVKPDSPFYDWLSAKISRDADHTCCSLAEFPNQRRAITRQGQVKDPSGRHEKDDRHAIDDRSRYVLGWTNTAKIATLEAKQRALSTQHEALLRDVNNAVAAVKRFQNQIIALTRVEDFTDYRDLDWGSSAAEIANLTTEREHLRLASDMLAQLTRQHDGEKAQLAEIKAAVIDARDRRSRTEQKRSDLLKDRTELAAHMAMGPEDGVAARDALDAQLTAMRAEAFPNAARLTIENCNSAEQEMRNWIQARKDAVDKRIERLRDGITRDMKAFKDDYPLETSEFDASVEAAAEYQAFLDRLGKDDLPRFVAKFKELLNVNTINEIANFNAQLQRERADIRERVERINESLRPIPYNPDRYIKLLLDPTRDNDIRDFQRDLKACTENTLSCGDDSQYSEDKFLQVKAIIDRFRGRPEHTEQDRLWSAKVTDVRHWFIFAVSERWRADDSEHEYYADSSGKSGGQKEKLAYTILAAGLAYQFGLKSTGIGARSFRFVAIDEAFGRATDESAQYGLTLFQQLGLQLLVITPLEKIAVIEPFVANVGFMQNEKGRYSQLLNLSIEEFRARRAEFAA